MVVKIVLLGPGYPIDQKVLREEIQKILQNNEEIEIYIMEDLHLDEDKPLHELFHKMLDDLKPDIVAAFYTKKGFSSAVDFELGSLTCRDSPKLEHLVLLIEEGLDEKTITTYIRRGLMRFSAKYKFSNAHSAATTILKIVMRDTEA